MAEDEKTLVESTLGEVGSLVGGGISTVVEALFDVIIPVIRELLPTMFESVQELWLAIAATLEGNEANFIMVVTLVALAFGAFVLIRGILSRGRLSGIAPAPISIPVVGAVPS